MYQAKQSQPDLPKKTPKHDLFSSKQKFESQDSDGSDLSYDSSLSSEQDTNKIDRIDFFKEEMTRFFLNCHDPQRINFHSKESTSSNWDRIAEQILSEAKQSSTSLESLAKRISLYRSKIEQKDLIDLLLQEKGNILREIQLELSQKHSELNTRTGEPDKDRARETPPDNMYLSWRKKREYESRNQRPLERPLEKPLGKPLEKSLGRPQERPLERPQERPQEKHQNAQRSSHEKIKTAHRSLHKTCNRERSGPKKTVTLAETSKLEKGIDEPSGNTKEQNAGAWRHLINFEAKTESGKQLCEQIRKNCSPKDQLQIKKVILNFLARQKEAVHGQVLSKCAISQKIQKMYSEEAKELLMFYPSKLTLHELPVRKDDEEDTFMALLKEISEGPLMKYWQQMQENKF